MSEQRWLAIATSVLAVASLQCVAEYDAARDEPATTGGADATGSDESADVPLECEDDEVECGGECVFLGGDNDHCGECFRECLAGTECALGLCRRPCIDGCHEPFEECAGSFCECAPGLSECSGDCVDLDTDADHCGQCDLQCGEDQACGEGDCVPGDCPGFADVCGRACTETDYDPLHCGRCFNECDLGEACSEGACYEYNTLPSTACGECPCPSVCEPGVEQCCFSERLDMDICVFGPSCP